MIEWLDDNSTPDFPDTAHALRDPNGLLAAGGGMSPVWLHAAYQRGIFPWHSEGDPRLWWSPAPRAVILPETFRIPRTIRKELNRSPLTFTCNLAFAEVMQACASTHEDQDGSTWIQTEMLAAYTAMSRSGFAMSVECWNNNGELCGGFYGIRIGQAFFGESMFSRSSNSSKLAFALTAPELFEQGVQMIDCQMRTDHLSRFGLVELPRQAFEERLHQAVNSPAPKALPALLRHRIGR
jgi:leucyl/phenylalanyl-tRNA---protein transferase